MAAASHEMTELLREVQKLQKELQPVRSAVTALQKRESETPNPAAAGASLHKVAARLETVKLKYQPVLSRLHEVLSEEVPAFLQQTKLLAAGEDVFDSAASDAGHDAAAPHSATTAGSRSSHRHTTGEANTAAAHAQEDAARLLHEVCPPSTPHLLQPENLRFTQQQLRLRAEMVEYLIATDRLTIADHVARSYGLPLQWFPHLVALHCQRTYGAAVSGSHSPVNGLLTTAPTPTASPLITPATRPRGGGVPPKSPIQLPSSAVPLRSGAISGTPRVQARSPAIQAASINSESFASLPPAHVHPQNGQSPSLSPSQARAGSVTQDSTDVAADTQAPLMPDLVARVVSTAMYLKDDYLDRMVLERTLEESIGLAPAPHPSFQTESASPSTVEQYRACVLSRIAHLPRNHLHTQSGDHVFDSAMMNIIEELLVYGLQRWAEDDAGPSEAVADAARGGTAADVLAAETKKRKAELVHSLQTDTLLTAEEMLLADQVWNEEILFLKRPTRFYCVETGLSTNEAAGFAGAAPRARVNGEVVSQLFAEAQGSLEATTGIYIT